jgi:hypothetical protein
LYAVSPVLAHVEAVALLLFGHAQPDPACGRNRNEASDGP